MAELIEKYYKILTNDNEPRYLKGHIYPHLCFRSDIHPKFYEEIKFDDVQNYLLTHFKLEIIMHNCEGKYCIIIQQVNTNNPCSWLYGDSFDKDEYALDYAYEKAIKIINEHNILYNEETE